MTDGEDRFEKSLYDLIRGLRNHKGNEREYIQNSLKECRAEVRSQDMGEPSVLLARDMSVCVCWQVVTKSHWTDRPQGDGSHEARLS